MLKCILQRAQSYGMQIIFQYKTVILKKLYIEFHGHRKYMEQSSRNIALVPSGDRDEGYPSLFHFLCYLVFSAVSTHYSYNENLV